jgi:hypothetical protein
MCAPIIAACWRRPESDDQPRHCRGLAKPEGEGPLQQLAVTRLSRGPGDPELLGEVEPGFTDFLPGVSHLQANIRDLEADVRDLARHLDVKPSDFGSKVADLGSGLAALLGQTTFEAIGRRRQKFVTIAIVHIDKPHDRPVSHVRPNLATDDDDAIVEWPPQQQFLSWMTWPI